MVTYIYEPNIATPKYKKQLLTDLKGEIDRTTIIVGNTNIPLKPWVDHPDERK